MTRCARALQWSISRGAATSVSPRRDTRWPCTALARRTRLTHATRQPPQQTGLHGRLTVENGSGHVCWFVNVQCHDGHGTAISPDGVAGLSQGWIGATHLHLILGGGSLSQIANVAVGCLPATTPAGACISDRLRSMPASGHIAF